MLTPLIVLEPNVVVLPLRLAGPLIENAVDGGVAVNDAVAVNGAAAEGCSIAVEVGEAVDCNAVDGGVAVDGRWAVDHHGPIIENAEAIDTRGVKVEAVLVASGVAFGADRFA